MFILCNFYFASHIVSPLWNGEVPGESGEWKRNHMRREHPQKKHKCNLCGKVSNCMLNFRAMKCVRHVN